MCVFCFLFLSGTMIEKLSIFSRSGSDFFTFILFIFYQVPYFAVKMMPIATLLAVLFCLGGLVSRGEWKAGMAGGWRPFDMIKPVLLCSLSIVLLQFAVQEFVSPGAFMMSNNIYRKDIKSYSDWKGVLKKNISFSAGEGLFVTCRTFDGYSGRMNNVILGIYKDGRLEKEYNSETADWDKEAGEWVFKNGYEIIYGGAFPRVTHFAENRRNIKVPPSDLVLERLVPDGVSMRELHRRIKIMRGIGASAVREQTLFWSKLAAPLSNLVMALIGCALAIGMRTGSKSYSFGLAIACGFIFWMSIIFVQEMGNAELLPPILAGFIPCAFFGSLALWLLKTVRAF